MLRSLKNYADDAALASASAAANATPVASGDTSEDNPCDGAPPQTPTSGAANGTGQTTVSGDDFGSCNPTMKFEGGLGGRPATEFTFQSQDPAIIAVQQEALNPSKSCLRLFGCANVTRHHH